MHIMCVLCVSGVGGGADEGESDRVSAGQLVRDDAMCARRPHPRLTQHTHPVGWHSRRVLHVMKTPYKFKELFQENMWRKNGEGFNYSVKLPYCTLLSAIQIHAWQQILLSVVAAKVATIHCQTSDVNESGYRSGIMALVLDCTFRVG